MKRDTTTPVGDISETDLFEAILQEGEREEYDPARHLLPRTVAARWRCNPKTALEKLSNDPRLRRVTIRDPKTGRPTVAFVKA